MRITRFIQCAILATVPIAAAAAQTFDFATPSDDRWQYPFNFSGGFRTTASCFSSLGTGTPAFSNFNDRDGVLIVAWNTAGLIAPGQGAANYDIESIVVTVTNEPLAEWPIDLSTDEWFTFDFNNDGTLNADGIPRGQPGDTDGESDDADAGRPLELFGAGFGPTYTAASWNENSAYVGGTDAVSLPRDPFPFVFEDGTGTVLHCEDSVQGQHNPGLGNFTPTPWAIGVPVNYVPDSQPVAFDIRFSINLSLSDGRVRSALQEQLNQGRVFAYITCLADTEQFGSSFGIPSLYSKEAVQQGINGAKAPQLTIVLHETLTGDLDGNGCVDIGDLATLLANFGTNSGATPEQGDTDGDGDVDLTDLAALLSNFGTGSC